MVIFFKVKNDFPVMTNGGNRKRQKREFFLKISGLFSNDVIYRYGRRKGLIALRPGIERSHHIHPAHHLPKSGIPLTVRVILPAKVEPRLVTDTDKKLRCPRPRVIPRKRDDPIGMKDMSISGRLMRDSRQADGLAVMRLPDPALYQIGDRRTRYLIIVIQDPVKRAGPVKAGIDIGQESPGRLRCLAQV